MKIIILDKSVKVILLKEVILYFTGLFKLTSRNKIRCQLRNRRLIHSMARLRLMMMMMMMMLMVMTKVISRCLAKWLVHFVYYYILGSF